MNEADLMFEKELIDTVLNIGTFVFIGILIWLYTAAPTTLDE
jgi:hypothetical protein